MAARAVKAREARLRFLANPTSVFIPFVGPAPTPSAPSDKSAVAAAPAAGPAGGGAAIVPRSGGSVSSSLMTYTDAATVVPAPTPGGGLPYGMAGFPTGGGMVGVGGSSYALTAAGGDAALQSTEAPPRGSPTPGGGGTASSITSYHPSAPNMQPQPFAAGVNAYFAHSPAALRVAPAEPIDADALRAEREAAAEEAAAKAETLAATTLPGTTQHKSALLAMLAKVEEGLAEQAARRRDVFMHASNVLMGAYDIKPQTTEVEDDKKKKKR